MNYPDDRDNPRINANVQFYAGEIAFRPYGLGIDEFHERAWGDYRLLEEHHGYNPSPRAKSRRPCMESFMRVCL